jgi:hypothetical protein
MDVDTLDGILERPTRPEIDEEEKREKWETIKKIEKRNRPRGAAKTLKELKRRI